MKHSIKTFGLFIVVTLVGMVILPDLVYADTPAGTCSTDPAFNIPATVNIIQTIVSNIECILFGGCRGQSISESLFQAISGSNNFSFGSSFGPVIVAALTLFVIIFGISFMLGIVQLSLVEFTIRMFKFSLIAVLLYPVAWSFFYSTVGIFFHEGTNWLIGQSIMIALGTVPGVDTTRPFAMVDYAIATAFSAKMFVTIMAMLFTGPYGWLFFILMVLGLGSFIAALFQAVWIYLMAMVVRAFLFGLAPLFLPFLLFSRTRHLFDGWLNQLVNTMLQPVLLFTFFSFFVVLVQASMENILATRVCIMPGAGLFDGLPGDVQMWRMTVNGQPYSGEWGWRGPLDADGRTFEIAILDVIIFILLTQLAWRFNSIAINIAKEIAGVSTTFNVPGAFSDMLSPRHSATSRAMSAANRELEGLRYRQGSDGQMARNLLPDPGQRPGGQQN